jgi:hypothetical protein
MLTHSPSRSGPFTLPGAAVSVGLCVLLGSAPARAHFVLQAPACYSQQDGVGSPQKSEPCGQADPTSPLVATGTVTHFQPGQTIDVTIDEKIMHPGHYRIALAADQSSLPPDPMVTAGSTPCGSAAIESSPTLPVLVDGILEHTTAFSGPQTVQVTLPAGMTCDQCVLQVVEFMSSHPLNNPGGCFYHHCANISIGASADAASTGPDAGEGDALTADGASTHHASSGSSSGGCSMGGRRVPTFTALANLAVLAVLWSRRRRSDLAASAARAHQSRRRFKTVR